MEQKRCATTLSAQQPSLRGGPQKTGLFGNPVFHPHSNMTLGVNGNYNDWLSQAYDLTVTSWKKTNTIQGSLDSRRVTFLHITISPCEAKQLSYRINRVV